MWDCEEDPQRLHVVRQKFLQDKELPNFFHLFSDKSGCGDELKQKILKDLGVNKKILENKYSLDAVMNNITTNIEDRSETLEYMRNNPHLHPFGNTLSRFLVTNGNFAAHEKNELASKIKILKQENSELSLKIEEMKQDES